MRRYGLLGLRRRIICRNRPNHHGGIETSSVLKLTINFFSVEIDLITTEGLRPPVEIFTLLFKDVEIDLITTEGLRQYSLNFQTQLYQKVEIDLITTEGLRHKVPVSLLDHSYLFL